MITNIHINLTCALVHDFTSEAAEA